MTWLLPFSGLISTTENWQNFDQTKCNQGTETQNISHVVQKPRQKLGVFL